MRVFSKVIETFPFISLIECWLSPNSPKDTPTDLATCPLLPVSILNTCPLLIYTDVDNQYLHLTFSYATDLYCPLLAH